MLKSLRFACLGLLMLAGCDQVRHLFGASTGAPAPTSTGANPTTPTTTAPAQAGGWTYNESPTAALANDGPVQGVANGKPITLAGAYFEPGMKSWELHLTQSALESPTGFPKPGDQFISIELPETPASGKSWSKPLKYGDGFFQIADPKDASHTTSWNASNAYYVQITNWMAKPYDPNGPMFQQAGVASGKVYVAYQGGFGFQNSGVAGSFTNVPVRYMGKPPAWMGGAVAQTGNVPGLPPANTQTGNIPGLPPAQPTVQPTAHHPGMRPGQRPGGMRPGGQRPGGQRTGGQRTGGVPMHH